MTRQRAVFVPGPEPQVVLHVLMIHDCTGPAGPIAAERIRWFVGPDWLAALEAAIYCEASVGVPAVAIQQGLSGREVHARVGELVERVVEQDARAKRDVEAYY